MKKETITFADVQSACEKINARVFAYVIEPRDNATCLGAFVLWYRPNMRYAGAVETKPYEYGIHYYNADMGGLHGGHYDIETIEDALAKFTLRCRKTKIWETASCMRVPTEAEVYKYAIERTLVLRQVQGTYGLPGLRDAIAQGAMIARANKMIEYITGGEVDQPHESASSMSLHD